MFTGIIEAKGEIQQISALDDGGARLTIAIPFASELTLGESVAVNGCCLTVTEVTGHDVAFDLLQQTLNVTNLGQLKSADTVNLERAVLPTDRLSGHLVQGHVDETAAESESVSLPAQPRRKFLRVLCAHSLPLTTSSPVPSAWTPSVFAPCALR